MRETRRIVQGMIDGSSQASQTEKLADFSYANVAGVLDFLRGNTAQQRGKKLEKLYELAHGEAIEIKNQHEALQKEVAHAWSSLAESVERLKRIEAEKLGRLGN